MGKLFTLIVALSAGFAVGGVARSEDVAWADVLLVGGVLVAIIVAASVPFALGPLVGRHVEPEELEARYARRSGTPAGERLH